MLTATVLYLEQRNMSVNVNSYSSVLKAKKYECYC